MRHVKIPGYVTEIDRPRWWAQLDADEEDLVAEMSAPLPEDAEVGSLFFLHRTKRGETYLYWPRNRWTKRQVKSARREGRVWADQISEAFGWK